MYSILNYVEIDPNNNPKFFTGFENDFKVGDIVHMNNDVHMNTDRTYDNYTTLQKIANGDYNPDLFVSGGTNYVGLSKSFKKMSGYIINSIDDKWVTLNMNHDEIHDNYFLYPYGNVSNELGQIHDDVGGIDTILNSYRSDVSTSEIRNTSIYLFKSATLNVRDIESTISNTIIGSADITSNFSDTTTMNCNIINVEYNGGEVINNENKIQIHINEIIDQNTINIPGLPPNRFKQSGLFIQGNSTQLNRIEYGEFVGVQLNGVLINDNNSGTNINNCILSNSIIGNEYQNTNNIIISNSLINNNSEMRNVKITHCDIVGSTIENSLKIRPLYNNAIVPIGNQIDHTIQIIDGEYYKYMLFQYTTDKYYTQLIVPTISQDTDTNHASQQKTTIQQYFNRIPTTENQIKLSQKELDYREIDIKILLNSSFDNNYVILNNLVYFYLSCKTAIFNNNIIYDSNINGCYMGGVNMMNNYFGKVNINFGLFFGQSMNSFVIDATDPINNKTSISVIDDWCIILNKKDQYTPTMSDLRNHQSHFYNTYIYGEHILYHTNITTSYIVGTGNNNRIIIIGTETNPTNLSNTVLLDKTLLLYCNPGINVKGINSLWQYCSMPQNNLRIYYNNPATVKDYIFQYGTYITHEDITKLGNINNSQRTTTTPQIYRKSPITDPQTIPIDKNNLGTNINLLTSSPSLFSVPNVYNGLLHVDTDGITYIDPPIVPAIIDPGNNPIINVMNKIALGWNGDFFDDDETIMNISNTNKSEITEKTKYSVILNGVPTPMMQSSPVANKNIGGTNPPNGTTEADIYNYYDIFRQQSLTELEAGILPMYSTSFILNKRPYKEANNNFNLYGDYPGGTWATHHNNFFSNTELLDKTDYNNNLWGENFISKIELTHSPISIDITQGVLNPASRTTNPTQIVYGDNSFTIHLDPNYINNNTFYNGRNFSYSFMEVEKVVVVEHPSVQIVGLYDTRFCLYDRYHGDLFMEQIYFAPNGSTIKNDNGVTLKHNFGKGKRYTVFMDIWYTMSNLPYLHHPSFVYDYKTGNAYNPDEYSVLSGGLSHKIRVWFNVYAFLEPELYLGGKDVGGNIDDVIYGGNKIKIYEE